MSKTKITWTEQTWNPITGCTAYSDGCRRCYAKKMALRLQGMGKEKYRNGFKVTFHPDVLCEPAKLKKPARIFVCSMSDLFHKDVPNSFIVDVFKSMKEADHHIYQVLTKRSHRMKQMTEDGIIKWPDHVWAGVSVENTKSYNRIDDLVTIDVKTKFLSVEPFLSEVDISRWMVNWVIAGGESGPGTEMVNAEWVRKLRDQCIKSNTAFFFKQWGGSKAKNNGCILDGKVWHQYPEVG